MLLLQVVVLLLLASIVNADWKMWVEEPIGSDDWILQSKHTVQADCERYARELTALDGALHQSTDAAHTRFSCLPGFVDPRPESALAIPQLLFDRVDRLR